MEKLKEMKKWIERIEGLTEFMQDSTIKRMRTGADSLKKNIDKLRELYFFTDGKGGIRDDSDKLISKLYTAAGYGNNNPLGSNEENYLKYTEAEVKLIVNQIDALIQNQYLPWVDQIEKIYPMMIPDIRKL